MKMICGSVRRINEKGFPAVLYLHPREVDPDGPRIRLAPVRAFAVYGPRGDAREKLRLLLERFRFGMLREMVEEWQSA
jgi:hypothetical protein